MKNAANNNTLFYTDVLMCKENNGTRFIVFSTSLTINGE